MLFSSSWGWAYLNAHNRRGPFADGNRQQANGISETVDRAFAFFHLPLTLPSILTFYVVLVTTLAVLRYWQTIETTSIQRSYIVSLRDTLLRDLLHAQWRFVLQRKTTEFIHTLTGQIQTVVSSPCIACSSSANPF